MPYSSTIVLDGIQLISSPHLIKKTKYQNGKMECIGCASFKKMHCQRYSENEMMKFADDFEGTGRSGNSGAPSKKLHM
jgi:hypothetical protein